MFLGTTTTPIRSFMAAEIRRTKPRRMIEPFAGNFIVSQVCGVVDRDIEVLSGDVSMYSVALGHALAGTDSGIRLTAEIAEDYADFGEAGSDPLTIGALILVFAELGAFRKRRHVPYYAALEKNIRQNQPRYLELARAKLVKARANLPTLFRFVGEDALTLLPREAREGDSVFFDPPFWVKGYKKMFEGMEECFSAPAIPFTDITDELKLEMLEWLDKRGCRVYYRPEHPIAVPFLTKVFEYERNPTQSYLVYANQPAERRYARAVFFPEASRNYDSLFETDVLTAESIVEGGRTDSKTANHFRALWTKKAVPKNAGSSWLWTVDGKVAGVTTVNSGQEYGNAWALVVSDAGTTWTRYERIGKLILHLILTKEFLDDVNERFLWTHVGFTTIAYTTAAVSMKYRGLFSLHERREGELDTLPSLVYRAQPRWLTVREAYAAWFSRYGQLERSA